jgi:hypothetical protein
VVSLVPQGGALPEARPPARSLLRPASRARRSSPELPRRRSGCAPARGPSAARLSAPDFAADDRCASCGGASGEDRPERRTRAGGFLNKRLIVPLSGRGPPDANNRPPRSASGMFLPSPRCSKLEFLGHGTDSGPTRKSPPAASTSRRAPDTLESRLAPWLFLAGEVLDIDGDCGGFNPNGPGRPATRGAGRRGGAPAR